jgi:hypothetical protein
MFSKYFAQEAQSQLHRKMIGKRSAAATHALTALHIAVG